MFRVWITHLACLVCWTGAGPGWGDVSPDDITTAAELKAELETAENSQAWHDLTEDTFARLWRLAREGLSTGDQARLLRVHIAGLHERWLAAEEPVDQDTIYRAWCQHRLTYLDKMLLDRGRYQQAEEFTQEGVTQGLSDEDAGRERVHRLMEMARKAQYRDSIRDQEARYWLTTYKERIAYLIEDAAERQAEASRMDVLLSHPDPEIREAEATRIKWSFNGTNPWAGVPWRQHDVLMAEAQQILQSNLAGAADDEAAIRSAVDTIDFATRVEQLYLWPAYPMAESLMQALALGGELGHERLRVGVDAVYALALAKRGQRAQGLQLAESLNGYLEAEGQAVPEPIRDRAARLIREVVKEQSKPALNFHELVIAPDPPPINEEPNALLARQARYDALAQTRLMEVILTSDDDEAAAVANEALLRTLWRSGQVDQARELSEQIIARLPEDASPYRHAMAELMSATTLSWKSDYPRALRETQIMADRYQNVTDERVIALCRDALVLCYSYALTLRQDPDLANSYLTIMRQRYPGAITENRIAVNREYLTRLGMFGE